MIRQRQLSPLQREISQWNSRVDKAKQEKLRQKLDRQITELRAGLTPNDAKEVEKFQGYLRDVHAGMTKDELYAKYGEAYLGTRSKA